MYLFIYSWLDLSNPKLEMCSAAGAGRGERAVEYHTEYSTCIYDYIPE